ncbi:hypothetical protein BGZ94_010390, partial [Podila epigama]
YDLPLRYLKKIKECPHAPHDPTVTKLCETCGWAGPRESWPELPPSSSSESDSDDSLSSDGEKDDDKNTNKKQESQEEKKAREAAANTPKVMVQIQGDGDSKDSTAMEVDDAQAHSSLPVGCTGSCQTGPQVTSQDELSKMADEINRVHLS